MEDISRYKAELRKKQRDLRRLLNEWNPIGVMPDKGGLSDEYDCLLGLLGNLRRGDSREQLADYLSEQLRLHFALDPDTSRPGDFAMKIFAWYWADPLPGSAARPGASTASLPRCPRIRNVRRGSRW